MRKRIRSYILFLYFFLLENEKCSLFALESSKRRHLKSNAYKKSFPF